MFLRTVPTNVSIGETIRNGVLFNLRGSPSEAVDSDALVPQVQNLLDLLRERDVSCVLVGGLALQAFVGGRNTQDIDLILAAAELVKMPELVVSDRDRQFALAKFGQVRVDLLFTADKLFALVAKKHCAPVQFLEREVLTATVRGLFILKLYALPSLYRQMDWERVRIYQTDLGLLLDRYAPDTGSILQEIQPFVSEWDLKELTNIVRDLELNRKRFQT